MTRSAFNSMDRRKLLQTAGGFSASLALPSAFAQAAPEFPQGGKAVRVVVGFPPGIGVDAQARAVTPKLSELLGVPVVIDNKPGAGTLISAQEVMKSAPDGHTIFYSASSTMAQIPHTLSAATYDPMKAFTPITLGARGPLCLVVNNQLGLKDVKELIAYGKANKGKLSYGSFGIGTSAHIFGETFAKNAGIELTHVPYRGSADLSADLQENRIQMAFDAAPSAINNAKSGKVKLFAVAAPTRWPFIPEVPTFKEQGVADVDIVSFLGWYGPAGMHPDIVRKLNAALVTSIGQQSVKDNYAVGAYTAESSTPQQLAAMTKEAYDQWGGLVKRIGIPKQ
jgi:tripartite-type tricarboxylate transporter receptor subunit TctC